MELVFLDGVADKAFAFCQRFGQVLEERVAAQSEPQAFQRDEVVGPMLPRLTFAPN